MDRGEGGSGDGPKARDGSASLLCGVVGLMDVVSGRGGKRVGGVKLEFGGKVCRRGKSRPVCVGFGEAHDIDVMFLLEGD